MDVVWHARRLHARCGVHGVAKERELGHFRANQAADDRPGVDADAQRDRLLVVRHEHRRRLAEHRLCKLHDAQRVLADLVGVHLVNAHKAVLVLLDEPCHDDVTVADGVELVQAKIVNKIVKDFIELVQEVHHLLRLNLLGHVCEANDVTEEHHDALVRVGELAEVLSGSRRNARQHELDDVPREELLEHPQLRVCKVCQLVLQLKARSHVRLHQHDDLLVQHRVEQRDGVHLVVALRL
mmetsp:Transcript_20951/g.62681  ORF Transcript_20951/g.62681 Transcript_20951/m.62681 type:complete len:239 (-) Transcript_20951:805-1521(-)